MAADINNDGKVNVLDLNVLKAWYGKSVDCALSPAINNTCTDSDGGINYYVKGITTYVGNVTDFCTSNNSLREYYCVTNGIESVNTTCSYGCINGACLNQTNQTNQS